jgi:hypothetical protein
MNASFPYGPDRSLLHAVLVLLGGAGLVAGVAYLLTAFDVPLSRQLDGQATEIAAEREARPAPGSAGPVPTGQRRRHAGDGAALAGGRLPGWVARPAPPPRRPTPSGTYTVEPDFGHAEVGAPSASPDGGASGGAAVADAGGSSGGAPQTGSVSLTPDLGGESSGGASSSGEPASWRSEARTLASRTRSLSRELGHLDRGDGASSPRSASEAGRRSGTAATASEGSTPSNVSGPGVPDDPNQVPLGGAEWLAAAGAAYALNRLRNEENDEDGENG